MKSRFKVARRLGPNPEAPRRIKGDYDCDWSACRDEASHRAHLNPLEAMSDPRSRPYDLYLALEASLISSAFSLRAVSKTFKAAFDHPVVELQLLPALLRMSVCYDFRNLKVEGTDLTLQEYILQEVPDLPLPALESIALNPHLTQEGVLAFMEQKRYFDLLGFTLALNLEPFMLDSDAPLDALEAFRLASPALRAALALRDLPGEDPSVPPKQSLARARNLLNQHNSNPEAALELIEVMSKGWAGNFEDFSSMVSALI